MFLGNSPGPNSGSGVSQWLRFSDALEGVAQDCFHEVERFYKNSPIRLGPVAQIIAKPRGNDGIAVSILIVLFQRQIPYAVRRP